MLRRCSFLLGLVLASTVAPVDATQPLDAVPARGDGLATIFTTSGQIQQIGKQTAQIAFFANKPFWGPPRYGNSLIVLWPADTLFITLVAGGIPVTIDGKKAGFAQLAVGQAVTVQYNVVRSTQTSPNYGMDQPYMYCAALRIDAHTTSPAGKHQSENGRSKTGQ